MPLLDRFEHYLAAPNKLSRRRVVGRLAKGSFALVAAIGGIAPFHKALAACNCQPHQQGCCNLCFTSMCPNGSSGECPDGETPYEWICHEYVGQYLCSFVCGECYTSCCSFSFALCGSHCPCIAGAPTAESMLTALPVRAKGEQCH